MPRLPKTERLARLRTRRANVLFSAAVRYRRAFAQYIEDVKAHPDLRSASPAWRAYHEASIALDLAADAYAEVHPRPKRKRRK